MDTPDSGLEITNEHPLLTLDLTRLVQRIRKAVSEEGFRIEYLGVVLTGRQRVHELNREYLNHNYPTDVLSFSLDEDATARGYVDGEVYVDLDMAAERAPEFGAEFDTEASRYVLHGVLHLLGYDDSTDDQRSEMQELENKYLAD